MEVARGGVELPGSGQRFVTDGGLETDLIFHHGIDLPDFAAFPLLSDADGRARLTAYYHGYAAIARDAGAGLMLESPTWRANPDWGRRLGFSAADLDRINTDAIALMIELRGRYAAELGIDPILVSGVIGPRGDGYSADERVDPDDAAAYHRPQIAAFAAAGADLATALTLTHAGEAIGIVRAARDVGLPVAVSFTVETDGRLPDGSTVAEAISVVDAVGGPDHYLLNCAHPTHILRGLDGGASWLHRIVGVRPNASVLSHAELDASEELDEGDLGMLVRSHADLVALLPALTIVGGCCGTDARHVAALWGVTA